MSRVRDARSRDGRVGEGFTGGVRLPLIWPPDQRKSCGWGGEGGMGRGQCKPHTSSVCQCHVTVVAVVLSDQFSDAVAVLLVVCGCT